MMRIMSDEAPLSTDAPPPPPRTRAPPQLDSGRAPKKGLRLASLFSGGKDSAYAAYDAQAQGHEVACLVSAFAKSEESMLLHSPNIRWVGLQAEAMRGAPPLLSLEVGSDDTQRELDALRLLLQRAKSEHGVQGVVHGGIRSEFQRSRFAKVCGALGLAVVSPLWMREPAGQYMRRVLDAGFVAIITAVSAGGLDGSWLGRRITPDSLAELHALSERHGFALDFEGGEAETFVLDCPLFESPIEILDYDTVWDGYRGRFEILDARIMRHA